MQSGIDRLSLVQRRLVLGMVLENKTFEQMVEELAMDVDTLREYYDDALLLLKQSQDSKVDSEV